jgi:hypothetical protein
MRNILKTAAKKIPPIRDLVEERDRLKSELLEHNKYVKPGHFYSPIPSIAEIKKNEHRIFGDFSKNINGIELSEDVQMNLLKKFKKYYDEIPFKETKMENLRYFFENTFYSYSDAIFLFCMIRHAKPNRIIEIGSGHSSCVILDTNELFFDYSIKTIFIEPFPERLLSLIKETDRAKMTLIPKRLQDVELNEFESLQPNDILFIDSTHVSKINSDVNNIFFEILPCLNSGVYIHFHDVFYPFEYPKEWIYEGRAWNENYILRAFLLFNNKFAIILFNTFLEYFHEDFFRKYMPLCLKNKGGSIWIQKL